MIAFLTEQVLAIKYDIIVPYEKENTFETVKKLRLDGIA